MEFKMGSEHYMYAASLLIAFVVYRIGLIVYRLTLHPLAKFPGPRIAAVTSCYQFYYDVIQDGQFPFHLQDLHKRYGPFVRTNSNEVHINEPSAYHEIFRMRTPFLKHEAFYKLFGLSSSSFGVIDPEEHKRKRAALNPSFSRRSIFELEPLIQGKVDTLCSKLEEGYAQTGRPVNMHDAYQALTIDVVSDFSYAKTYEVLECERFRSKAMDAFDKQMEVFLLFKYFPIVPLLLDSIPFWLASFLLGDNIGLLIMEQDCLKQVKKIIANPESRKDKHQTIFHRLLDIYPGTDKKTMEYLGKEGLTVIAAGTHTTRQTLTVGTVYSIQCPEVGKRLFEELKEAIPDINKFATYQELEKLPYLTAFIKESLRLSYGLTGTLPRVVPPEGATIAGQYFPGGTVVTMDAYSMHHNESVFPDSFTFNPDRWLAPNSKELEKYLVSFSAGSRQCLGLNLAWAELYMTIAKVFRKFELQLHEHKGVGVPVVDRIAPAIRGGKVHCTLKVREE